MSQEIVSRLLSQRKKMLFESDEILTDITNEKFKDRIPDDDPEPKELKVEDLEDEINDEENTGIVESSEVKYAPCEFGSTDVAVEDGVHICNE